MVLALRLSVFQPLLVSISLCVYHTRLHEATFLTPTLGTWKSFAVRKVQRCYPLVQCCVRFIGLNFLPSSSRLVAPPFDNRLKTKTCEKGKCHKSLTDVSLLLVCVICFYFFKVNVIWGLISSYFLKDLNFSIVHFTLHFLFVFMFFFPMFFFFNSFASVSLHINFLLHFSFASPYF